MFKDIAATRELAWAPTFIETRKEGLGKMSTDSSSPDDDDDVILMKLRLPTLSSHLTLYGQHKTKERIWLCHHPHRAKGRKEEQQ